MKLVFGAPLPKIKTKQEHYKIGHNMPITSGTKCKINAGISDAHSHNHLVGLEVWVCMKFLVDSCYSLGVSPRHDRRQVYVTPPSLYQTLNLSEILHGNMYLQTDSTIT